MKPDLTTGDRDAFTCPACGRESFIIKKPVYDGFTKIGEESRCASCNQVIESPEPEAAEAPDRPPLPTIFDESDREQTPELFDNGEKGRLCRYCRHYVINPFKQWCSHHLCEVEATDTCESFEARAEPED